MIGTTHPWSLDVERGPGWLFVRPSAPGDSGDDSSLADSVWSTLEQHFTYRVVVECDELGRFTSAMIAQLLLLHRRIRGQRGTLRLVGLSPTNQELLRQCRVDGFFPHFCDRAQAVLGLSLSADLPRQPR
jgi:anti-anti-sigma regulatory factor